MLQRLSWLMVMSVSLAVLACKPASEPLFPVQGSVTFGGTPIADGQIYFTEKTTGVLSVALPIQNGKYQGQVKEGTWRVEIHAYKDGGMQSPMPDMPPEPVRIDYIPPKYGSQSELSATVKSGGVNTFDFQLNSDSAPASGATAKPEGGG